jgi:peptide methionine sulfoxide reductase msrA/msrB
LLQIRAEPIPEHSFSIWYGVIFNPDSTDFERLAKLFFEIHDPTQVNRQGPDIGDQYRSAVFYRNDNKKITTEKLIGLLTQKGYHVVTQVAPAKKFWKAEDYHQQYYAKNNKVPYCHRYEKKF